MKQSDDGLIRLRIDELLSSKMQHLISDIDLGKMPDDGSCGTETDLTGYTEWLSESDPKITLGWDWFVQNSTSQPLLRRINNPSSNLQIVDADGNDLPWEKSLGLIASFIDALPWQENVMEVVSARYA